MDDVEALSTILSILKQLEPEAQNRVLNSIATFLNASMPVTPRRSNDEVPPTATAGASFTKDRRPSPKEFMRDKRPSTDVERVACLAYYLTHYRDTPHFTTLEISSLNTEAALPKFSNASFSVNNATTSGYLVAGPKGAKQLSAAGERFVEYLPDQDAARGAMKDSRPRRASRRTTNRA